jgi:23S rRNA (guanosine2251-2'-O)-methyltransferase
MRIITGFHAIEEALRAAEHDKAIIKNKGMKIVHSKPGPRVKKILASASLLGIPAAESSDADLNTMVKALPPTARDHRGIVLVLENDTEAAPIRLDECVKELANRDSALVVVLDSITDPHNVGAIIRSADQFGVDLVILPEHRGATDFEVISRTSAGASAWVKIAIVSNLVRAVESLKEAGFWVYGADAGGTPAPKLSISGKTALVMGSEGAGIARLLREKCDSIVSIPTMGKLDSLNVSVAAGVLLYEIRRNGDFKQ